MTARTTRRRVVWWLFDRIPTSFQDWLESWARTVIVHRRRQPPNVEGLIGGDPAAIAKQLAPHVRQAIREAQRREGRPPTL